MGFVSPKLVSFSVLCKSGHSQECYQSFGALVAGEVEDAHSGLEAVPLLPDLVIRPVGHVKRVAAARQVWPQVGGFCAGVGRPVFDGDG